MIGAVGIGIYILLYPLLRASPDRAQERSLVARRRQDEQVAELIPLTGEIRTYGAAGEFERRLTADTEAVLVQKRTAVLLGTVLTPIYQGIGMLVALVILGYATTRQLDVPALGAVALLLLRPRVLRKGSRTPSTSTLSTAPSSLPSPVDQLLRVRVASCGRGRRRNIHDVRLIGVDLDYYGRERPCSSRPRPDPLDRRPPRHRGAVRGRKVDTRPGAVAVQATDARGTDDGVDASTLSAESFSREVAYVPQTPLIVRGTVHENISLFRPSIDLPGVEDRPAGRVDGLDQQLAASL